ncbi:MAG: DUF1326 domain-containing protein [Terriglobia bacterium]
MTGKTEGAARHAFLVAIVLSLCFLPLAGAASPKRVQYDGCPWRVKGQGVVCCPCNVPCPCRTNSVASYGHCEATLYLRITKGNYGNISLNGMQVIDSGGMCAILYRNSSALYFEPSSSSAQRLAFLKLMASFSGDRPVTYPYVRVVPFDSEIVGDHFFKVVVPGTIDIIVDRNWGQATPPMPMVAAPDYFSNVLQYAENIRYRVHDLQAGIDFDYSHRQANYRKVDVTDQEYRLKSMLIQFASGQGGFTPGQMKLIKAQHLPLPDLRVIQQEALRLKSHERP